MRFAVVIATSAALTCTALAWARQREAVNGKIFYTTGGKGTLVNADGSGATAPTLGRGARVHYLGDGGPVAFSPDGRRVAYICSKYVNPRVSPYSLCVEGIDGSGLRMLTHAPKNTYVGDSQPAWSRDGKRLAFVRSLVVGNGPVNRRHPVYRIAVVNSDGTGEHLLPEPPACVYYHESRQPDWGPHGELIYDCDSPNPGLMLAVPAERMAVPIPCDGWHPHFSPDGSRILVSSSGGGLATFSPDARATPDSDQEVCDWRPISEDSGALSAVWSPDGSAIAFLEGDSRNIFVVNADGSAMHRIVKTRGDIDEAIAWLSK